MIVGDIFPISIIGVHGRVTTAFFLLVQWADFMNATLHKEPQMEKRPKRISGLGLFGATHRLSL